MLAPVCPSQTQVVLDQIQALRKPWSSLWQSGVSARLQVCKLAIIAIGDVFLHTIAAAMKVAFFAVNLVAHPLSVDIHKNGILGTFHHLGFVLRSAFAVMCVSLPALAFPSFALTAYEWMALRTPKSVGKRALEATKDLYLGLIHSERFHLWNRTARWLGKDSVRGAARVTTAVGPHIAKVTTPLAMALAATGVFCMVDDFLIHRHLSNHNNYDKNEWMRCEQGLADGYGVYGDYHVQPSSWYPGFRTVSTKVLHNTFENRYPPEP